MYVGTEKFAGMEVKITKEGDIYYFESEKLPVTKGCAKGLRGHIINHVGLNVLFKDRMLLGKKTMGSWPGYWFFGGSRNENQDPQDAASFVARSKLGLDINSTRFSNFCTFIFILPEKGPKNTNLHVKSVESIIMSAEIGPGEISKIKCGKKKYQKAKFFLLDAVINKNKVVMDEVHPAVRLCAMKIVRERFNPKLL